MVNCQFLFKIQVARKVLENTRHSLLVGDLATEFAIQMGFTEETLQTDVSKEKWTKWNENNCQPNFWMVRENFRCFWCSQLQARSEWRTSPASRSGIADRFWIANKVVCFLLKICTQLFRRICFWVHYSDPVWEADLTITKSLWLYSASFFCCSVSFLSIY